MPAPGNEHVDEAGTGPGLSLQGRQRYEKRPTKSYLPSWNCLVCLGFSCYHCCSFRELADEPYGSRRASAQEKHTSRHPRGLTTKELRHTQQMELGHK